MNFEIIRANTRGVAELDWLSTRYSFSFADYYDKNRMGFGALRVLNEDIVAPSSGFDTHSHDNMEIVTIVLSGELEHKDSTGGHGVIHENEVQVMSAGSGVRHSEKNPSKTTSVHLLQIWIHTAKQNIKPRYDQKKFTFKKGLNEIVNGSSTLQINQDAKLSICVMQKGDLQKYELKEQNGAYIFVINGEIEFEKQKLQKSDAVQISNTKEFQFKSTKESKVLVIEVPLFHQIKEV